MISNNGNDVYYEKMNRNYVFSVKTLFLVVINRRQNF